MKKLGIIGGAGPLASSLFYETLVRECYQTRVPLPEMVLLSYPFTRGLNPQESDTNGLKLKEELTHCAQTLKQANVDLAVLVCNTLHLQLPHLSLSGVPFISIPELVLKEIGQIPKKVLLLATQNTCHSPLYHQSQHFLFCPSPREQKIIDQAIDHILEGKILKEDAIAIRNLILKFQAEIEGVILGCTDLPVLHHHFPLSLNKPVYDSVKIPVKNILRYL